jgi:peroxiredoxin
MTATPSTMLRLGTKAPDFRLPDVNGKMVCRDDFIGFPALLVIFMCNHCPYVKHVSDELIRMIHEYKGKGVGVVAISSNDASAYPDDSHRKRAEEASKYGYIFPYLYDESQGVAKAFHAACTPDFFLFDKEFKLVYRGQMDGSRPGNGVPVTGSDLRAALEAVLTGKPVLQEQKGSLGCNIKWKPGNEPEYFNT